jgi:hypothetical protein
MEFKNQQGEGNAEHAIAEGLESFGSFVHKSAAASCPQPVQAIQKRPGAAWFWLSWVSPNRNLPKLTETYRNSGLPAALEWPLAR